MKIRPANAVVHDRLLIRDRLLMKRTMEAYHLAGHSVVLRILRGGAQGTSALAGRELRPRSRRSCAESWTPLERRLVVAAAGTAAERELARRSGLRWRRVSNRCDGLEVCRQSIAEETGENPGDWIYLHWIRAVTRARRALAGAWSEVVLAAATVGLRFGVDEAGPCPTAGRPGLGHGIASSGAGRGPS